MGAQRMRGKGITYDTGLIRAGTSTREAFDPRVVEGDSIVEWDDGGRALRLRGSYTRDEAEQATYGVVKVLEGRLGHTYPGMPWEPKAAFAALADAYRG